MNSAIEILLNMIKIIVSYYFIILKARKIGLFQKIVIYVKINIILGNHTPYTITTIKGGGHDLYMSNIYKYKSKYLIATL